MTAEISISGKLQDASGDGIAFRSDTGLLRNFAIAAGICCSVLFIVIGLRYELEMYADGSMFSYAIAVQNAWAFHWHNISGRLFVYLFEYVPADAYVDLTKDAYGGIVVYGLLLFAAPLLGLAATFAADRSKGRIIFSYACASTACLCPLVFGFPTETWIAHSLFWPTLAICLNDRGGVKRFALIITMLFALVFSHEGALIFSIAILATLLMRGMRDAAFLRTLAAFLLVLSTWIIVKIALPPDDYMAEVMERAALHVFDLSILTGDLVLLLFCATAAYTVALYLFWRLSPAKGYIYAGLSVALGLAVYWIWFDHALHAENRYYLRTIILLATPGLGALAAIHAFAADGKLRFNLPFLPRLMTALTSQASARIAIGALALLLLIHTVETAKFVNGWARYKAAIQALAMGSASDPALGDARFVSSGRIEPDLNRLSWESTTQYLSVLVSPNFAPARLVLDPGVIFFWLSCQTATANLEADRLIPVESRRLVQKFSCLHR